MRKTLLVLSCLLVGGCLADRGPDAAATTSKSSRVQDDDSDGKPKQVCEHTMEGSEAKTFCY